MANTDGYPLDIQQLEADLEFVLVEKARMGSDILQRVANEQEYGGSRMYAEVHKWFTETSGLGLAEQTARLMDPKPAAKEEHVAEAIELWEERCNRLARHGPDYEMANIFKKVVLKKILVGRTKENYELWEAERRSFDELLKKVKEHARAKKFGKDAAKGKTGVALGATNASQEEWSWHSWADEEAWEEVNAVIPGKGERGRRALRARAKARAKRVKGKEARRRAREKERVP